MKFRATIQLNGKTATGIQVPAKVVKALGPSKRPAVRATVAGYTYRSGAQPRVCYPVSTGVLRGSDANQR
jgi:hypothetical protein